MEKYLIEEYNVFEDKNYLKNKNQIEDYFKDNGNDWFECGQGFCQDTAELICKIEDKFYRVNIQADIGSSKQEYGDRLYRVDCISKVEYKEINKPQPKEKISITYNLKLTKNKKNLLENFMKENNINFIEP